MKQIVKAILYLVLLVAVLVLGVKFYRIYQVVMHNSPRTALVEGGDVSSLDMVRIRPAASNSHASTNLVIQTNEMFSAEEAALTDETGETNAPTSTNTVVDTNKLAAARAARARLLAVQKASLASEAKGAEGPTFSTLMSYGIALFGAAFFLSLLLANDFSHVVAERFHQFILSDEGESIKAPEYDHAEQVWADGRHLEAIQLMRDYLKRHPRELYVALRIAEIYEKDLGNYLAAALEHEEVLKHRLRPEQWGWAAIHLANLYSGKLNQMDKAVALLRRIETEFGETAAALKARSRLSQLQGEDGGVPGVPVEIEEDPVPPSNLPRGFRPKNE